MNDILLKLNIPNPLDYVVDNYFGNDGAVYMHMENGVSIEVIEGRRNVDFHYFMKDGESEGIGIRLVHDVFDIRKTYYKLYEKNTKKRTRILG